MGHAKHMVRQIPTNSIKFFVLSKSFNPQQSKQRIRILKYIPQRLQRQSVEVTQAFVTGR